jgi:Predicted nucleotide-binding protein containing TIR-like domain
MNSQVKSVPAHKQRVFLGSSREAEWLAREIEGDLYRFKDTIEVDAWYHFGSWAQGSSTLESLETRLRECDFAVLVLSDDDRTQSRVDQPRPAPRDNVVFELGLAMGRLGRDRAFFFFPKENDFKLPSDLFGITALPYGIEDRTKARQEVSPLCTLIVKRIDEVVRRQRGREREARPRLELKVKFPQDNGNIVDDLNHLSGLNVSTLRVRVDIDDDTINDLRVYFGEGLNLRKSTWTYKVDQRGQFFWASPPQLGDMKKKRGGADISFDVEYPRQGTHQVDVVALGGDEEKSYSKRFILNVN